MSRDRAIITGCILYVVIAVGIAWYIGVPT